MDAPNRIQATSIFTTDFQLCEKVVWSEVQSEPRNLLEEGFGVSELQKPLCENVCHGGQQHGKEAEKRSVERNIVERPRTKRLHFDGSQRRAQQQESHPMRHRETISNEKSERTVA